MIPYSELNFVNNFNPQLQVCGISCVINNKRFNFVSVYRAPLVDVSYSDWYNLLSQIPASNSIVGGDLSHIILCGVPELRMILVKS